MYLIYLFFPLVNFGYLKNINEMKEENLTVSLTPVGAEERFKVLLTKPGISLKKSKKDNFDSTVRLENLSLGDIAERNKEVGLVYQTKREGWFQKGLKPSLLEETMVMNPLKRAPFVPSDLEVERVLADNLPPRRVGIKWEVVNELAAKMPNRDFVASVVAGLKVGFDLNTPGFEGRRISSQKEEDLMTELIDKMNAKEISSDRRRDISDFEEELKNLCVNRMAVVYKQMDVDKLKPRLITNGSAPKGDSVNLFTDNSAYSEMRLDSIRFLVRKFRDTDDSEEIWLWMDDLSKYYRQLPTATRSMVNQCFRSKGRTFMDLRMVFGFLASVMAAIING